MTIGPDLLNALRMVELRHAGDYEALTACRAPASNQGSILYRLREPWRGDAASGGALSKIGDTAFGGLQLSYVTERFGTEVVFPEAHPLSMCIMTLLEGAVHYYPFGSATATTATAGSTSLLQVLPGAQAFTTDGSERLNLWVRGRSLVRGLEAVLGQTLSAPLTFAPEQSWPHGVARSLRRLVRYAAAELVDPHSLLAAGVRAAAFEDLVIRTLLEGVSHNYTDRLARTASVPVPRTVRRAEDFIRARAGQPVVLNEVAEAAGCSVRALQLGFRQFRNTTPMAAMRQAQLDAARQALARGEIEAVTVGEVARRYGFTNPGRFTRLYAAAFGTSPAEALRPYPSPRTRRR